MWTIPTLRVHNVYIVTAKNPFPQLCTTLFSAGLRCCEIPRKCPTVGHSISASNASERIFQNLNEKGKCTKNGGMHRIMKGLGIFRFMFPCVYCVTCLTYTHRQTKAKVPNTYVQYNARLNGSIIRGIFSFHLWYYQILWLKKKWYWEAFSPFIHSDSAWLSSSQVKFGLQDLIKLVVFQ